MRRYDLYIGQGLDKDGKSLRDTLADAVNNSEARTELFSRLAKDFGGYSSSMISGGWHNAKGELITEPSIHVTVHSSGSDSVYAVAKYAKELFNQEAVLVTSQALTGYDFI